MADADLACSGHRGRDAVGPGAPVTGQQPVRLDLLDVRERGQRLVGIGSEAQTWGPWRSLMTASRRQRVAHEEGVVRGRMEGDAAVRVSGWPGSGSR